METENPPNKKNDQFSLLFYENIDFTQPQETSQNNPISRQQALILQSQQLQQLKGSQAALQSSINQLKQNLIPQNFQQKQNNSEIKFKKPVKISLIRIVRPKINCHENLKSLESITQQEQIKQFSLFYRDLQVGQANFSMLMKQNLGQEKALNNQDILITLQKPIYTDFLILRGNFQKITLAIYGEVIEETNYQDYVPMYQKSIDIDYLENQQKLQKEQKQQQIQEKTENNQIEEEKQTQDAQNESQESEIENEEENALLVETQRNWEFRHPISQQIMQQNDLQVNIQYLLLNQNQQKTAIKKPLKIKKLALQSNKKNHDQQEKQQQQLQQEKQDEIVEKQSLLVQIEDDENLEQEEEDENIQEQIQRNLHFDQFQNQKEQEKNQSANNNSKEKERKFQRENLIILKKLCLELNVVASQEVQVSNQQKHTYYQKLEQLNQLLYNLSLEIKETANIDQLSYEEIPENVVNICLYTLSQSKSDYIRGIILAQNILNSKKHGKLFLQKNGLQKLFQVFSIDSDAFNFMSIKKITLQVINQALDYDEGNHSFFFDKIQDQILDGQKNSRIKLEEQIKKLEQSNAQQIKQEEEEKEKEKEQEKAQFEELQQQSIEKQTSEIQKQLETPKKTETDSKEKEESPKKNDKTSKRSHSRSISKSVKKKEKRDKRDKKTKKHKKDRKKDKERDRSRSPRSRSKDHNDRKNKSSRKDRRDKKSRRKYSSSRSNSFDSQASANFKKKSKKVSESREKEKEKEKDKEKDKIQSNLQSQQNLELSRQTSNILQQQQNLNLDKINSSQNLSQQQQLQQQQQQQIQQQFQQVPLQQQNSLNLQNQPQLDKQTNVSQSQAEKLKLNQIKKEEEDLAKFNFDTGYQIILYQFQQFNQDLGAGHEQIYQMSRQIIQKSMTYFYLQSLKKALQKELIPNLSQISQFKNFKEQQKFETIENIEINENDQQGHEFNQNIKNLNLNFGKVNDSLNKIFYILKNFFTNLKHQTLINGKLQAGSQLEEVCGNDFLKEKFDRIEKLSNLKDIVQSDVHLLTENNIQLLQEMEFIPNLLLILSNPHLKKCENFNNIFIQIHNILTHIITCQQGYQLIFQNEKQFEVLLKILQKYQIEMQSIFDKYPQEFQELEDNHNQLELYLKEINFSTNFTDDKNFNDSLLNYNYKFYKNNINNKSDQDIINRGILAKQIYSVLKHTLRIINVLDRLYQIYDSVGLLELDQQIEAQLEIISLLEEISCLSSGSNLAKIALNKFMWNGAFKNLFTKIFTINNLDSILEKETELTLLCETMYNALTFDNGGLAVIFSYDILDNLKNLNYYLGLEPELFKDSKALRKNARLLINLMQPLNILQQKEFGREDEQIVNFIEQFFQDINYVKPQPSQTMNLNYKKEKLNSLGQLLSNRNQINALGTFDKPDSNLIRINLSLKLYNLWINYNKNFIIKFLQLGLTSSVNIFSKQLSSLIQTFITKDLENEYYIQNIENKCKYVDSLISVLMRLVSLIYHRITFKIGCEYVEIPQIKLSFDDFDSELIGLLVEIFVSVNKIVSDPLDLNLTQINKDNLNSILSLILTTFKNFFDQSGRKPESKEKLYIQERFEKSLTLIFAKYFLNVEDRFAIISLFSSFFKFANNSENMPTLKKILSTKIENMADFSEYPVLKHYQSRFFIEEMLRYCIKSDSLDMQYQVLGFLESVLNQFDYDLTQSVFSIFKSILCDTEIIECIKLKKEGKIQEITPQLLNSLKEITKINEYLSILCLNSGFSCTLLYNHLDEYLIFFLKYLDEEQEKQFQQSEFLINQEFQTETQKSPQKSETSPKILEINQNLRKIVTCRNSILKVFTVICDNKNGINSFIEALKTENPDLNQAMIEGEDVPHISHIQDIMKNLNRQEYLPRYIAHKIFMDAMIGHVKKTDVNNQDSMLRERVLDNQIINQMLLSQKYCIKIIQILSKNLVGQTIILYSEISEPTTKPNPSIIMQNLHNIFKDYLTFKTEKEEEKINFFQINLSEQLVGLFEILSEFLYSIVNLTINPQNKEINYSKSRKQAIKQYILGDYNPQNSPGTSDELIFKIFKNYHNQLAEISNSFGIYQQVVNQQHNNAEKMICSQKLAKALEKSLIYSIYLLNYCQYNYDSKKEIPETKIELKEAKEPSKQFVRLNAVLKNTKINSVYKWSLDYLNDFYNKIIYNSIVSNWKQIRFNNLGLNKIYYIDSFVQNNIYKIKNRNIDKQGWETPEAHNIKEDDIYNNIFNKYEQNNTNYYTILKRQIATCLQENRYLNNFKLTNLQSLYKDLKVSYDLTDKKKLLNSVLIFSQKQQIMEKLSSQIQKQLQKQQKNIPQINENQKIKMLNVLKFQIPSVQIPLPPQPEPEPKPEPEPESAQKTEQQKEHQNEPEQKHLEKQESLKKFPSQNNNNNNNNQNAAFDEQKQQQQQFLQQQQISRQESLQNQEQNSIKKAFSSRSNATDYELPNKPDFQMLQQQEGNIDIPESDEEENQYTGDQNNEGEEEDEPESQEDQKNINNNKNQENLGQNQKQFRGRREGKQGFNNKNKEGRTRRPKKDVVEYKQFDVKVQLQPSNNPVLQKLIDIQMLGNMERDQLELIMKSQNNQDMQQQQIGYDNQGQFMGQMDNIPNQNQFNNPNFNQNDQFQGNQYYDNQQYYDDNQQYANYGNQNYGLPNQYNENYQGRPNLRHQRMNPRGRPNYRNYNNMRGGPRGNNMFMQPQQFDQQTLESNLMNSLAQIGGKGNNPQQQYYNDMNQQDMVQYNQQGFNQQDMYQNNQNYNNNMNYNDYEIQQQQDYQQQQQQPYNIHMDQTQQQPQQSNMSQTVSQQQPQQSQEPEQVQQTNVEQSKVNQESSVQTQQQQQQQQPSTQQRKEFGNLSKEEKVRLQNLVQEIKNLKSTNDPRNKNRIKQIIRENPQIKQMLEELQRKKQQQQQQQQQQQKQQ